MRALPFLLGACGATLFVAAGCQLVAGVRTDAEVADGGSAATGSTSSGDTTTVTSSSSGAGPCMADTECTAAGSVCVEGACKIPTCSAGIPFDVYTPAEIGADKIENERMILVGDSRRTYIGIVNETKLELSVRSVEKSGGSSQPVTFALPNGGRFSHARLSPTDLRVYGVFGGSIGEVVFQRSANDQLSNPSFFPFNVSCPAGSVDRFDFALTETAVKIVFTCNDNGTRSLYVGGSDAPAALVASGPETQSDLDVKNYAYVGGQHLIFSGDDNDQAYFRVGANAAALATAKPLAFSQAMGVQNYTFLAVPLPTDDGVAYVGAELQQLPSVEARIFAGAVTSLGSSLSAVPPTGLTNQATVTDVMGSFGNSNRPSIDATGIYLAMASIDATTLALMWLSREGKVLELSAPLATSTGLGIRAAAAFIQGIESTVVWIESGGGVTTVRGASVGCSLNDPT